jgi:hypothetical protein
MQVRIGYREFPPTLVRYTSEMALPDRFSAVADGGDLPYRLRLDIVVDENGPRCTAATFEQIDAGEPVRADLLRRMVFGEVFKAALETAAIRPLVLDGEIVGGAGFVSTAEFEAAEREVGREGRRWRLTEDHLAAVAEVYADATRRRVTSGQRAPTEAVRDHFEISRPAAGRWVQAARRAGMLTDTGRGEGRGELTDKARALLAKGKRS